MVSNSVIKTDEWHTVWRNLAVDQDYSSVDQIIRFVNIPEWVFPTEWLPFFLR